MDKADKFDVDETVADADPGDYDGLVLPGGVANPDFLRIDDDVRGFVPAFCEKIVEEFCEGRHEELAEATTGWASS